MVQLIEENHNNCLNTNHFIIIEISSTVSVFPEEVNRLAVVCLKHTVHAIGKFKVQFVDRDGSGFHPMVVSDHKENHFLLNDFGQKRGVYPNNSPSFELTLFELILIRTLVFIGANNIKQELIKYLIKIKILYNTRQRLTSLT